MTITEKLNIGKINTIISMINKMKEQIHMIDRERPHLLIGIKSNIEEHKIERN